MTEEISGERMDTAMHPVEVGRCGMAGVEQAEGLETEGVRGSIVDYQGKRHQAQCSTDFFRDQASV